MIVASRKNNLTVVLDFYKKPITANKALVGKESFRVILM